MKRYLYFIALILLALAAGAATGIYRARRQMVTPAAVANNAPVSANTTAAPTAATPAVQPPVTLPAYQPVKYNAASTVEALAVNAVNAFEKALNANDAPTIQKLFTESVNTGTVPVVVAGMKTRPISVTITDLSARADDSVLLTVAEKRQDETGGTSEVKRTFELVPRESDYAVASYAIPDNTDPLSGF